MKLPILNCPCVLDEKPRCSAGKQCWHFGNHQGECTLCRNTGNVLQ